MPPLEATSDVKGLREISSKLLSLQPLATLMGTDEDLTIFRRFDEVNLLRLLLLQDEVETLTKEFEDTIPKASEGQTPERNEYLASYVLGRQAVPPSEARDEQLESKRNEKWEQLRKKLREYNGALIEVAQVKGLDLPDMHDITRLQNARLRHSMQSKVPLETMSYWDEANTDDFIILRTEAVKGSRMNIWLKFIFWLIKWRARDMKHTQTNANNDGIVTIGQRSPHMSRAQRAKKFASTSRLAMALFGGVALIIPTVIMAKFEGIDVSLITTSISVLIFGLLLAFGATDSTGKDVLAATAAYTAVLVVFIGTSLSGTSSSIAANVQSNVTETS